MVVNRVVGIREVAAPDRYIDILFNRLCSPKLCPDKKDSHLLWTPRKKTALELSEKRVNDHYILSQNIGHAHRTGGYIYIWSNPTRWTHFWNLFFQILIGFWHVIPCIVKSKSCKVVTISSLNVLEHIQLPHCCRHFPHYRGHSHCCGHIHFSHYSGIYDIHYSGIFDIQSCCMRSTYHITEYIPAIKNIF